MSQFQNQTLGSHDDKAEGSHSAYQYVNVWFDETKVSAFKFHAVNTTDVMKRGHRLFGISVEARHVWAATTAFSCVSNVMAVAPDGSEFFVTWVSLEGGKVEEWRMGDKYGPAIARMERTGYIQK